MKKAADLVSRLFEHLDSTQVKGVGSLLSNWQRCVGNDESFHSRPFDVKNGTLMVVVDSSAWMMKMRFSQERTLARLNQLVPELNIHRIMWQLGELGHAYAARSETSAVQVEQILHKEELKIERESSEAGEAQETQTETRAALRGSSAGREALENDLAELRKAVEKNTGK